MNSLPKVPEPKFPVLNETIEDVNQSAWTYTKKHYQKQLYLLGIGSVVWWVVSIFIVIENWDAKGNGDILTIFIVPVIAVIGLYGIIVSKIRHEFYKQFASANNFIYVKKGWNTGLEGSIFKIGHSKSQEDIITGQYQGKNITLLNYSYVKGSGKQKQTFSKTVFEIEFDKPLPPILLLVDRNYFGGVAPQFTNANKIKLEGDYDNFFDLYVQKKYEIEALQIFNPEFMQATKVKWPQFSLEFTGKQLYVYCNHIILTKKELYLMFELVQYLILELTPILDGMEGSLKALNEQSVVKNLLGSSNANQLFPNNFSATKTKISKLGAQDILIGSIIILVFILLGIMMFSQ